MMIASLSGQLTQLESGFVVIENAGIGYKVAVSQKTRDQLRLQAPVQLFTYLHVRENALDLYGFINQEERIFFELLLSISGLGPKSALGILSAAAPAEIQASVLADDPTVLTQVSGIGKKTAERIILELKSKLEKLNLSLDATVSTPNLEVLEALVALGYRPAEARAALKELDPKLKNTNAKLKAALKLLGR